jgi:hypothetical protein
LSIDTNGHEDIERMGEDDPIKEIPTPIEMELVANRLRIEALMQKDQASSIAMFKTAYMLDRLAKRRRKRAQEEED